MYADFISLQSAWKTKLENGQARHQFSDPSVACKRIECVVVYKLSTTRHILTF